MTDHTLYKSGRQQIIDQENFERKQVKIIADIPHPSP